MGVFVYVFHLNDRFYFTWRGLQLLVLLLVQNIYRVVKHTSSQIRFWLWGSHERRIRHPFSLDSEFWVSSFWIFTWISLVLLWSFSIGLVLLVRSVFWGYNRFCHKSDRSYQKVSVCHIPSTSQTTVAHKIIEPFSIVYIWTTVVFPDGICQQIRTFVLR